MYDVWAVWRLYDVWDVWGCMGMYGMYGLYGHTLMAWDHAWTLYGWAPIHRIHALFRTAKHTAHATSAVRALQSSSGSSTKAAPPALAQGAIGTPDERVHRPERAEAPPDDVVSCRAREKVAGVVFLAGACAVDALTFCW